MMFTGNQSALRKRGQRHGGSESMVNLAKLKESVGI